MRPVLVLTQENGRLLLNGMAGVLNRDGTASFGPVILSQVPFGLENPDAIADVSVTAGGRFSADAGVFEATFLYRSDVTYCIEQGSAVWTRANP